ncbi:hypothetical protein LSTR_LSTR017181 [Laodelphax striatellus]|uniref:Uncharacterized protein n=1 Tax=Laodelphax striatellus TaxID=195883 RepID=A0A482XA21_LAOST|nr:hypothetical protein LSTR_LSTR017181 [Laodelphax striatellus]
MRIISERESSSQPDSGRQDSADAGQLHPIPGQGELHGVHERLLGTGSSGHEEFLAHDFCGHLNGHHHPPPPPNLGGHDDLSDLDGCCDLLEGGGGGCGAGGGAGGGAKGSQVSISTLSNVASSGYQSFAAYSQSSSPVDLTNNNSQGPTTAPPLAFTNPVYQHHHHHHRSSRTRTRQHSCSSSSEEAPPPPPTLEPVRGGGGSVPRTNPQCQPGPVARHGRSTPQHVTSSRMVAAGLQQASRRMSLESTRHLSDDDSSDDETCHSRVSKIRSHRGVTDQYEREIERLQKSVELLKLKLEHAENGCSSPLPMGHGSASEPVQVDESHDNMKNIIAR